MLNSMTLKQHFKEKISIIGLNRKLYETSKDTEFVKKKTIQKSPCFQSELYFCAFNDVSIPVVFMLECQNSMTFFSNILKKKSH